MWYSIKSKFLIIFLFVLSVLGISAQNIPEPMVPFRLVNDFANIFSSSQKQALEQRLLAYNDSTSTQIYVVTVTDLEGYPASDFAFVLGEKWKIGQSGKNNGLLILIKPKIGSSRGNAFIATGYGVEASITDAFAGRVVRDKMIPYFQENDYFGGVNAAVDAVMERLSGQFSADDTASDGIPIWAIALLFIVIFLIFSYILRGGGDQYIDGDGHSRRGGGGPIFFPTSRSNGSSSWGGGGFEGGFGGGGGGSFGGGGAGGSW